MKKYIVFGYRKVRQQRGTTVCVSSGVIIVFAGLFGVSLVWVAPQIEGLAGLVSILTATGIVGVLILCSLGYDLVRSAVAARRFERIFGFMPPETSAGEEALRKAVDRVLAKKAADLDEVYREEERITLAVSEIGETCATPEEAGRQVETFERNLREYAGKKKVAKSDFYSARDAAESRNLPRPFGVCPSYKDYLKGDYLKREVAA